ncbi:MAG: prenyltransferase [Candidatus Gastranaerophilaceae bacterium]
MEMNFLEKIKFWFNAARGYSLQMSIMSWSIPFLFGLVDEGSFLYGFISLIGIIFAHLGVNLFDDFSDYLTEKTKIKKGLIDNFSFQKGKCAYLFNGDATLKQLFLVLSFCFLTAAGCGLFLTVKCGITVLYLMLIAGIICILYPFLSYVALGEVAVGIVFAPLLYSGVYFVMTNNFSFELLPLSLSTGLLTVGLLHAHMFMDMDFDKKTFKITLCSLAGNKQNALRNQVIIMILAYINILIYAVTSSNYIYLITFLSMPTAFVLYLLFKKDIEKSDDKIRPNIFFGILENMPQYKQQGIENFMIRFMVARNIMAEFAFLACVAKIIRELL